MTPASSSDNAAALRQAASLANRQGQWRRASALCRRSLRLEIHPAALNTLAAIHAGRGEFARADELYFRTLALLRSQPDPALEIETLIQIADGNAWRGWFDQAEARLQEALSIAGKLDNAAVCKVLQSMAQLHQAAGRYPESLDVCDRLLTLTPADSPDAASVLRLSAEAQAALGHPRKSLELLRRSIAMHRRLLGETHAEVAAGISSLASLYESQSDFAKAGAQYREALAIAEASSGAQSPEAAAILNNLASLAFQGGDGDTPERLYRRALRIKERVFGQHHPEVARTLNNLAVLYKALGRLAEARPLIERALRIFETSLGRTHPQTSDCLKNLARLVAAESKQMLARARALEAEFRDVSHPANPLDPSIGSFRLDARRSPIHDVGIFAAEDIPEGVKVAEYTGKRVPRRNLASRRIRDRIYCVRLDAKTAIDGAIGGSGAQYINHCCDPNLRPVREEGRLYFVSRRAIPAGAELTVDYTYSKYVEKVPCHCGSPKCRGTINRK